MYISTQNRKYHLTAPLLSYVHLKIKKKSLKRGFNDLTVSHISLLLSNGHIYT